MLLMDYDEIRFVRKPPYLIAYLYEPSGEEEWKNAEGSDEDNNVYT